MTSRMVVLAGRSALTERLEPLIEQAGYTAAHIDQQAGYVARLADDQPVLIVVAIEGEWAFWVTTPRVSPATRRIPVVAAAPDESSAREALAAGASFAVTAEDAERRFPEILRENARRMAPEMVERLAADCGESLPEDAAEAIRKFNAGDYYHQHDLLEALWMHEPGPARNLYQAILQVGIAYFQVTRGNKVGAHKMMLRAQQWLAVLPDACQGVDVARLKADAMAVRAAIEQSRDEHLEDFDRTLLRPVVMVNQPAPK